MKDQANAKEPFGSLRKPAGEAHGVLKKGSRTNSELETLRAMCEKTLPELYHCRWRDENNLCHAFL